MKKLHYSIIFILLINLSSNPMYISTYSDSHFFPRLLNLIGSIHRVNFDEIEQIAVFNLGLTSDQIIELNKIKKVAVYDIELVNPDMLTPFDIGRKDKTYLVKGWYSWKPVGIKQALDMFPHVLHCDAGSIFLNKIDNLYNHIKQQGYYFVSCGHSIGWMTTKNIVEKFGLNSPEKNWILQSDGLNAGFIGITRKYYDSFILPMYYLAHDIKNFIDDGTTPCGHIGNGRCDQTLFSIVARLNGLYIHKYIDTILINDILRIQATGSQAEEMKKYIKYK